MKIKQIAWLALSGLIICTLNARDGQGSNEVERRIDNILSQMTLAQKIDYISGDPIGVTGWNVKPIPLQLNSAFNPLVVGGDGGFGVRSGDPSVRYPSALALAATWNVDRARDFGTAIAHDTRAKGFYAILAPGMDFYRTPFGGRNGEYMTGEDPFIGWTLVPEVINAIQTQGVWATSKHYAANDQETHRNYSNNSDSINEIVDERTLREIYLPPFEAAIKQGHTASVMDAFPRVNGDYCAESNFLNNQVLKTDWGFKGFVESDYNGINNGIKAALGGCDLDMPAGNFFNSQTLLPAIQSGQIPLSVIDDKVRRILREVVSFGFLDRAQQDTSIPLDRPESENAALQTAREGIVLLKREGGVLPLQKNSIRSIAVIGKNAQGVPPASFGSTFFIPVRWISEIDGIKNLVGPQAKVDFIDACTPDPSTAVWEVTSNSSTGQGLQGEYFNTSDLSGSPQVTRIDNEVNFDWTTDQVPVSNQSTFSARWTGQIQPTISGDQLFKIRSDGGIRLYVNGQKLIDTFGTVVINQTIQSPVPVSGKISLQAGQLYNVQLEYQRVPGFVSILGGFLGVQFSWASLQPPASLAGYNAVVMGVGTNNEYEGEEIDRPFDLPEFQSELITNVSQVNPRTIVVLHGSGSFNVQQWVNQVPALLNAWLPGQNGGQALAEILFGEVNPSGKLPITFEKRIEDNPAYATFPFPLNNVTATTLPYNEGIFIGYRGYEAKHIQPQFPFGFGLSYTAFGYSDLKIAPPQLNGNNHVNVTFTVTNTGNRAGAEIAELYVGQQNPSLARPIKELKGFQKVFLQPGASQKVTLELDQRSVAYFNTTIRQWDGLPGTYNVLVGASSQDIRLSGQFLVKSEFTFQP
jgi:beta-glucosidase